MSFSFYSMYDVVDARIIYAYLHLLIAYIEMLRMIGSTSKSLHYVAVWLKKRCIYNIVEKVFYYILVFGSKIVNKVHYCEVKSKKYFQCLS